MRFNSSSGPKGRRLRLVALAGVAGACVVGGPAFAEAPVQANAPDTQSLQGQVRTLTALVQDLAQRDQQQIQALTAQVQALQTRLTQEEVTAAQAQVSAQSAQTLAQQAETRTAQNDRGGFDIQGAPRAADSGRASPRITQNANDRFSLQSADGKYSIGLTGDIQFDTGAYVNFSPASKAVGPQALSNGVNARRARIGITGTAFGDWATPWSTTPATRRTRRPRASRRRR